MDGEGGCGYVAGMAMRTILVIFASTMIKAMILAWWDRYKAHKAEDPIPLVLRGGIYVPWGPVEKVRHYGWRLTQVWMAYIGILLLALIYVKLIAPNA